MAGRASSAHDGLVDAHSKVAAVSPARTTRLLANAESHSAAILAVPIGIFETDAQGAVTFVNSRWCELTGINETDALGAGWTRMLHPDDHGRVIAEWQAAVEQDGEVRIEFRIVRPDGVVTAVDARGRALTGPDGATTGWIGVLADIDAAITARDELTAERTFVDTVLEIAGSLICVFDPDGRFLRFNRACELISGYTSEEVIGRPFYDFLIPSGEIPAVQAALGRLRAGELPAASENHWVARDGSLRMISWSNASFFDADGVLTHIVSTGTDVTEQRRTEEALRGIEAVGSLLAKTGPTDETMSAVLGELSARMGYAHLAVFLGEGDHLRLAAHRGYDALPLEFDSQLGIVGRVFRTAEPALVCDVWSDPDYLAGDLEVSSEIDVPLVADGETLGVLSVASVPDAPLGEADLRLAQTVAERLATAVRLGREQRDAIDRARLLSSVSAFARRASSILDADQLESELIDAVSDVVPVDTIGLTLLDRVSGTYRIRRVGGAISPAAVGAEVVLGSGAAGQAIERQALVVLDLTRDTFGVNIRDLITPAALHAAAVPLIREGAVFGAISVGRRMDHSAGFSSVECEVLSLIGSHASLAFTNAELVQEVRELAIHDPLTGLYNRRHFDSTLELVFARWRRAKVKPVVSAVMFDLDHFGRFNKEHGHQTGDAVLRTFAGILNERFRSADLVARFGGEEFIAILEHTDLAGAMTVAEEVRMALADRVIAGPDGQALRATVSAGCAVLDPAEPNGEALIGTADVALSMAKRGGRNQVVAA
jgi:diguanylate cyclase (GGDEF)-like protein/PAS domain S-box-containing protein